MNMNCLECGKELVGRDQSKYCSRQCLWTHQGRERKAKRDLKWKRVCQICGKEFVMSYPSGKAMRGEIQAGLFCSRQCRGIARRKQAGHDAPSCKVYFYKCEICGEYQINKGASLQSICDACYPEGRRRYARRYAKEREIRLYNPKTIFCKECGIQYTTKYGDKRRAFCGDKCSLRFQNRICKGIRRARVKGLLHEPIDKKLVYERDHKRCQCCGVKVKFYKDVCHPRYAQLDHIIPLARGGTHTYDNVQILCRSCNIRKADGYLRDQLRLC